MKSARRRRKRRGTQRRREKNIWSRTIAIMSRAIQRRTRQASRRPIESPRKIFSKRRATSIRRWSGSTCRLREERRRPGSLAYCANRKALRSRRSWCFGAASTRSRKSGRAILICSGIGDVAIDMPGVADAPLAGSENAERLWDAVFDYIAERVRFGCWQVGLHGGSTGGYWATKVAHTHRDRLRAAVNQGGPAHFAFQKDWIVKAQRGEYPFELAETLACAFGRSSAKSGSNTRPAVASHPRNSRPALRAAALRQRRQR